MAIFDPVIFDNNIFDTPAPAIMTAGGGMKGRGVFPGERRPLPFDLETLRLLIRYLQLKLRM